MQGGWITVWSSRSYLLLIACRELVLVGSRARGIQALSLALFNYIRTTHEGVHCSTFFQIRHKHY